MGCLHVAITNINIGKPKAIAEDITEHLKIACSPICSVDLSFVVLVSSESEILFDVNGKRLVYKRQ
jgi:hypothetical protein